jgi:hypothetical protein
MARMPTPLPQQLSEPARTPEQRAAVTARATGTLLAHPVSTLLSGDVRDILAAVAAGSPDIDHDFARNLVLMATAAAVEIEIRTYREVAP